MLVHIMRLFHSYRNEHSILLYEWNGLILFLYTWRFHQHCQPGQFNHRMAVSWSCRQTVRHVLWKFFRNLGWLVNKLHTLSLIFQEIDNQIKMAAHKLPIIGSFDGTKSLKLHILGDLIAPFQPGGSLGQQNGKFHNFHGSLSPKQSIKLPTL